MEKGSWEGTSESQRTSSCTCSVEGLLSWALGMSEVVIRACWRTEWATFIPLPPSSQFTFLSVCLKAYTLAGDGVCGEGFVGMNQE